MNSKVRLAFQSSRVPSGVGDHPPRLPTAAKTMVITNRPRNVLKGRHLSLALLLLGLFQRRGLRHENDRKIG